MPGFAEIIEGNLGAAIEPYGQMFEMDQSNPMARLFHVWVLTLNRQHDDVGILLQTVPSAQRDTPFCTNILLFGKRRHGPISRG